jgi:DNA-binding PadR family transcriptional regulator
MRNDFWGSYASSWDWPPFGGFGGRARFFESGEVRLAILSLLSEGPKHGYQLMKELEERSGGLYRASAGSIYPTLQQLEDEGLIVAEQRDGKRVHSLTDAGRAELDKDPDAVRRIWHRAEQWEEWGQFRNPEYMMGLMHSFKPMMKAVRKAAGRVGRQPGGMDRIRAILDQASRDLDAL